MSPYPHHVVSLGYNTVPDGRDFSDNNVDWNPPNQKKYSRGHTSSPTFIPLSAYLVCHSEVNAVITAFKRTGDLSGCTLYTTLSPCDDCSLTVAGAGIRNLVFAKYYRNGCHMYDILGRIPDMDIR